MRKALNSCVEAVAVTAVVSDEVMDKLEHQAKVWGVSVEWMAQAVINKWASRVPNKEERARIKKEEEKRRREMEELLIGEWED